MTRSATGWAAVLAALLATALLAACGPAPGKGASSGTASTRAATAPATPHASPHASSPAAVTGCSSSGLKVVVDTSQAGAAAGSVYYPIDFTNTSHVTCTLFGYPGVSFASGPSGHQLGRPAARNPGAAAATVTLAPGAVAHATLQVTEAANYSAAACRPVTAHWLKIYPPNQAVPLYARFSVQACSARLPRRLGSQLSVYVVRPGAGKAGQAP
jgi:hypothetical protein